MKTSKLSAFPQSSSSSSTSSSGSTTSSSDSESDHDDGQFLHGSSGPVQPLNVQVSNFGFSLNSSRIVALFSVVQTYCFGRRAPEPDLLIDFCVILHYAPFSLQMSSTEISGSLEIEPNWS